MASQQGGWEEWRLKREALKFHVHSAGSYKIMIGKVLNLPEAEWDSDIVNRIAENIDNWEVHIPYSKHAERFKNELIARIREKGCPRPADEIEWVITHGSFKEFCALYPEPMRTWMGGSGLFNSGAHWQMWVDGTDEVQHLAHEGFETGRVDYKLYYGSPDSHGVWTRVVDAGDYHQYFECLECVRKLTNDPLWVDGFRSGQFDGVVMLGAGSGDKDQQLLQSMVTLREPKKHPLSYTLVDYSFYMLDATRRQLDDYLVRKLQANGVTIEALKQDFLAFKDTHEKIRPSKNNVAWIIPGGTFGNLVDEEKFFKSLSTQVKPRDILVIAVDTATEGIEKKYTIEQVRHFVEPAVREAWHALKLTGTIDEFLKENIRTRPTDGIKWGHSKVPNTKAVEISIKLEGKQKTVLLTSCRYQPEALTQFVTERGYAHRTTIESTRNKKFKHLVFEAVEK